MKTIKTRHIIPIAALIALLITAGCSTEKNTAQSRWWHSFNARYNTYYNGTLAYIDGSLEKETGNKDNFTEMIPLYTVGNKASRVAVITDFVYGYHVYDESVSHTFRTSLAYEALFCRCLEESVARGPYAAGLADELAFQNVRALKASFMAQRGEVDLRDPFVRRTRQQAKSISLTRGWRLFLWLLPFGRLGYALLRKLEK